MKAVIIEDDPEVTEAISLCFDLRWPYAETISVDTGGAGLDMVARQSPDIVILDIGLPDIDGFEVCSQIRSFSDAPIMMLTARDQEFDKIKGLEMGADDYITKPFSHVELLARINAMMRRSSLPEFHEVEEPVTIGKLWIDFAAREVRVDGADVSLTAVEYNLLSVLARNAGRVMSRQALLKQVWGPAYSNATGYLKVYIRRLRAKLGDVDNDPEIIILERGVGYKLATPRTSAE